MNKAIVFLIFLLSPFLGIYMTSLSFSENVQVIKYVDEVRDIKVNSDVTAVADVKTSNGIKAVFNSISSINEEIEKIESKLNYENDVLDNLYELVTPVWQNIIVKTKRSDLIYDNRILVKLGTVLGAYNSDKVEIKIFELVEENYRGVVSKVKTYDEKIVKVRLAENTPGKKESLRNIAESNNAVFAINGGGFYTELENGEFYTHMIGNTVVNGELVNGYKEDLGLFFVGVDKNNKLVGSLPVKEMDINILEPYSGVSFIPELLKGFDKKEIPGTWSRAKHPRSIIGKYANGDLVFIVIDGRQPGWSLGVSLEDIQDKLLEMGIEEAYNLDGGGSSAMYFQGEIINKPSDDFERLVPNAFIIEH